MTHTKKNTSDTYTFDTTPILLDKRAILTSMVTTGILGFASGILFIYTLSQSTAYHVTTMAADIADLQQSTVKKDVYQENQKHIDEKLTSISDTVIKVNEKIDKYMLR